MNICVFVQSVSSRTGQCKGYLPAGEDAGRGEEDDRYRVGGAQQAVAVEGGRDLSPELLAQRHSGSGGQLPAIGKHSVAEDGASRCIQGPAGAATCKFFRSPSFSSKQKPRLRFSPVVAAYCQN